MKRSILSILMCLLIFSAISLYAEQPDSVQDAEDQAVDAITFLVLQAQSKANLERQLDQVNQNLTACQDMQTQLRSEANALGVELGKLQQEMQSKDALIATLQAQIAEESAKNEAWKLLLSDIMKYLETPADLLRRLREAGVQPSE